jgi:hypothetical protein
VLSAVVCRSGIEADAGNKDAENFRQDVMNWLYDLGLADEIGSEEFDLLNSPLGALPERKAIDASWRGEGMAVLAWALNIIELPPHDQPGDSPMIAQSLGFMNDVELNRLEGILRLALYDYTVTCCSLRILTPAGRIVKRSPITLTQPHLLWNRVTRQAITG